MTDISTQVNELIAKAADCDDSGDAQRYSQAACNAANALCTMEAVKRDQEQPTGGASYR